MNEEYPADLLASLGELSGMLISEEDVRSTIGRIAQMAVESVEACDFAGVSLVVKADRVESLGATDPLAREIDDMQHKLWEGPCITSIEQQQAFKIDDFHKEPRWPRLAAEIVDKGVRSVVAVVLKVSEESLAALNLYARRPNAFTDQDVEIASILASHAAVALSNAQTHEKDQRTVRQLEQSVQTRTVIGQAVGIMMAQGKMPRDQAFDVLKKVSQKLNVKLNRLAEQVVEETESKSRSG